MANAEVYCKWANQGDGNRGAGAWSFRGDGQAAFGGGGIILLNMHAERIAWRTAWPSIKAYVPASIGHFPGRRFQVKFWVDQQICPSCQKWLIIDVISHLKQLSQANLGLIVELYAEVLFNHVTRRLRVQRSTVWPVEIGHTATYNQLPMIYN
jgi:hypothetical protein